MKKFRYRAFPLCISPSAKTEHFHNKVAQLSHCLLNRLPFPPCSITMSADLQARCPRRFSLSSWFSRMGATWSQVFWILELAVLKCSELYHFYEPTNSLYFSYPLSILSLLCFHMTVLLGEGLPSCGTCHRDCAFPSSLHAPSGETFLDWRL